jgi:parallel beta-helix repeat protein
MRLVRHRYTLALASCLALAACNSDGGGSTPAATPTSRPRTTKTPTPGTPVPTTTGSRTPGTPKNTRTATQTFVGTPPATRTPTITPTRGRGPEMLFVRESGNDANAGTSADAALNTVTKAAALIGPGTTVYVGPGRYREQVKISGTGGTEAAPVRFIADTTGAHTHDRPGAVVLDGSGATVAVLLTKAPNVVFDGFVITGAEPLASPTPVAASAVHIRSRSDGAAVQNCIIGTSGTGDAIRVDGSSNVLVFDNLIFDNDRGVVVTGDAIGAQLINNTIAMSARTGILFVHKGMLAPTGGRLINNIIEGNENNIAISIDEGPPTALTGYFGNFNLVFEPGLTNQTTAYHPTNIRGSSDVTKDPLFENLGQGDVRLAVTSPAVNKGTNAIDAALVAELFKRSATVDGAVDKTPLDIGYHYPR